MVEQKQKEARQMGLLGATAIGVGGMVGGGIFAVLGEAVNLAGGGTPEAFLIAGTIALLTAHSYAKLSVRFPSAGGTVVFVDRAFDHDLAAASLNILLWLSYLVTIALYASAFGSYAATFFVDGDPPFLLWHALASAGIILPAAINLLDPEIVSRSETAVVVVKLLLLTLVIVTGAAYVEPDRIAPSSFGSVSSMVVAGLVIFVAYEGFELIANAAEEVVDAKKNLPRAFYGAVLLVIVLYVLIALVVVGAVDAATLRSKGDYAMAVAAQPALGQVGFRVVAVAAVLATLSAINATIYGNARLGALLARERELPDVHFGKVQSRTQSEVVLILGISLGITNTLELTSIATVASASFLLVFAAVNLSAFVLARDIQGSRVIATAGTLACLGALGVLLYRSFQTDPVSLAVIVAFVVASIVFEGMYGRNRGRLLAMHRADDSATHEKAS